MTDPSSLPPPGWYPDPAGAPVLRWWNGGTWTDDTRAIASPSDPGVGPSPTGQRLRPVGDWMTETFRLLVGNAGQLFTLMVVLLLPGMLLAAVGMWIGVRDLVISGIGTSEPEFAGGNAGGLAVAAGGVVLYWVALVAFHSAVARHTLSARNGASVGWDVSMRGGIRRALPVMGWSMLLFGGWYFVAIFVIVFATLLGVVGVLVGIPLVLALTIVGYVRLAPVTVTSAVGAQGWRGLRGAARVTSGHFTGIAGRILLLILLGFTVTFSGSVLSGPLLQIGGGEALEPGQDTLVLADVFGSNVGIFALVFMTGMVTQAVSMALWAGGMSLIFQDLGGQVDSEIAELSAPGEAETTPAVF